MKRILNATSRLDKIAAFEQYLADTWSEDSAAPRVVGVEELPSLLNQTMLICEQTFERGYLKERDARLWSLIDETGKRVDLLIIGSVVLICQPPQ